MKHVLYTLFLSFTLFTSAVASEAGRATDNDPPQTPKQSAPLIDVHKDIFNKTFYELPTPAVIENILFRVLGDTSVATNSGLPQSLGNQRLFGSAIWNKMQMAQEKMSRGLLLDSFLNNRTFILQLIMARAKALSINDLL